MSRDESGHDRLKNLIISMDCVRAVHHVWNTSSKIKLLLDILRTHSDNIRFTTLQVPYTLIHDCNKFDISHLRNQVGKDVIVFSFDDHGLLYTDSSGKPKDIAVMSDTQEQLFGSILLYFHGGFMFRLYVDETTETKPRFSQFSKISDDLRGEQV